MESNLVFERKSSLKPAVILALVVMILAFLASSMGPLGSFWRPAEEIPIDMATPIQMALFAFLSVVESLALGLGVAFLVFGRPAGRTILPASPRMTAAAHLSISWMLINWWFHDNLHIHNGMDLVGLLRIDYIFHFTLIIAGAIMAYFFLTVLRRDER